MDCLDFQSLPQCRADFATRSSAPAISAVYYFIKGDECLYIGKTKNLRVRLRSHEKLLNHQALLGLGSLDDLRITWVRVPVENLDETEIEAIRRFRPRFNFNHVPELEDRKLAPCISEAPPEYLTTAQAAVECKVSLRSIQDWISKGILPAQKFGSSFMVKRADLKLTEYRRPRGRPKVIDRANGILRAPQSS